MKTNLVDIDSHMCSDKMLCAFGGQIKQLYYVVESIVKKYPQGMKMYLEKKYANDDEDYFARPNNPTELLLPEHMLPFIMLYLKEMKNECIEFMLHPDCSKFLKEKDCPLDELFNLSDDDALKFKDLFMENKISIAHKGCTKKLDELFGFVIDIMTKRIVIESPNVKVDQIVDKLVLIEIPQGVNYFDWTEKPEEGEPIEHKKNTDEKAVIIVKVPQVEEEEEIKLEVTDGDGEPKTEIIRRLVDEDQKEQAIVIQGRDVPGIKQVDAR